MAGAEPASDARKKQGREGSIHLADAAASFKAFGMTQKAIQKSVAAKTPPAGRRRFALQ